MADRIEVRAVSATTLAVRALTADGAAVREQSYELGKDFRLTEGSILLAVRSPKVVGFKSGEPMLGATIPVAREIDSQLRFERLKD